MPFHRVCVFCGAAQSASAPYFVAAKAVGKELAQRDLKLVYGGGSVGLMGEVAASVLEHTRAGEDAVLGVIPESMAGEDVSSKMLGRTLVVADMHERKAAMAREADAFVALPGGFGTLEELLEVVTWQQLGYHAKPVGLLNVGGFFDLLLQFFDHCVAQGFIREESRDILIVRDEPTQLLDALQSYTAPPSLLVRLKAEYASANNGT